MVAGLDTGHALANTLHSARRLVAQDAGEQAWVGRVEGGGVSLWATGRRLRVAYMTPRLQGAILVLHNTRHTFRVQAVQGVGVLRAEEGEAVHSEKCACGIMRLQCCPIAMPAPQPGSRSRTVCAGMPTPVAPHGRSRETRRGVCVPAARPRALTVWQSAVATILMRTSPGPGGATSTCAWCAVNQLRAGSVLQSSCRRHAPAKRQRALPPERGHRPPPAMLFAGAGHTSVTSSGFFASQAIAARHLIGLPVVSAICSTA